MIHEHDIAQEMRGALDLLRAPKHTPSLKDLGQTLDKLIAVLKGLKKILDDERPRENRTRYASNPEDVAELLRDLTSTPRFLRG